ncbi:MAG: preprotein translocase subunit SecG [Planctomycetota bacterium]|jgi:preprotein translocase subunit SecG
MTILPLLAVGFLMKVIAAIWFLVAVILILVILIQKGKGGGLSGAIGGGMAGNILGTKTGDFLTWFTIVLVGVFLLFSVLLAKFYKPTLGDYGSPPATETSAPAPAPQPIEQKVPEIPFAPGGAENSSEANSAGG